MNKINNSINNDPRNRLFLNDDKLMYLQKKFIDLLLNVSNFVLKITKNSG